MNGAARQLKGRAGRLARMMPSGSGQAARTPFVLLVVLLLGGGLIALLLLNSSLNEGSFRLSKLKKQTTDLTDEQQALQRDVDDYSAPDALARRARELGMVPGGSPAFLGPDGKVHGVPGKATPLPPVQQSVVVQAPPAPPAPSAQASTASTPVPARSGPPAAPPTGQAAAPTATVSPSATGQGQPLKPAAQAPTTSGR